MDDEATGRGRSQRRPRGRTTAKVHHTGGGDDDDYAPPPSASAAAMASSDSEPAIPFGFGSQ